jgi:hypothetical protein
MVDKDRGTLAKMLDLMPSALTASFGRDVARRGREILSLRAAGRELPPSLAGIDVPPDPFTGKAFEVVRTANATRLQTAAHELPVVYALPN